MNQQEPRGDGPPNKTKHSENLPLFAEIQNSPDESAKLPSAADPAPRGGKHHEPEPARAGGYDPGHPWHYLPYGDDATPMPVDDIPATSFKFSFKLPKDKRKRIEKLEKLRIEATEHLGERKARYRELVEGGTAAISDRECDLAYAGDAEKAWACSVALLYNQVKYCRGEVEALKALAASDPRRLFMKRPGQQGPQDANGPEPTNLPQLDPTEYRAADREKKQELIKQITGRAYELLAHELSQGRSESLTAYLKAMGRFHRYSFNNVLLIMLQNPSATRVAGFGTWKKLGRSVNKGEKGLVVMAPVLKTVGKREEVQEGGGKKEVPVRRIVNTKPVYVFDVSQTSGEPLPELSLKQRGGDTAEHLPRLEKLVAKNDIELEYVEALPNGALGVSHKGKVQVVAGLPPAERFLVLVHEFAHEVLHRDAERRQETTPTIRETEAEAVAFVVGSGLGLSMGTASKDYIQMYGGDPDILAQSLEAVRKTASEVLSFLLPETSG